MPNKATDSHQILFLEKKCLEGKTGWRKVFHWKIFHEISKERNLKWPKEEELFFEMF